jgi:RNA polymerase sigma-70 factor (ECF subfamily)
VAFEARIAKTMDATLPFPFLPSLVGDEGLSGPVPSQQAAAPSMGTESDRALVERVARGDRDAFTQLYRRYERPLFALLMRLARTRAQAEDWLQETFTRVWLAAGTHDPSRGQVRPWLYKIALNTARSELARKRHRTPHVSIDQAGLDLSDAGSGERPLAARLDGARRAEALKDALGELPDFMREVIVLRCGRELSFAEMAEVTGAPEGTLKSRFHRAVGALRNAVRRRERGGR